MKRFLPMFIGLFIGMFLSGGIVGYFLLAANEFLPYAQKLASDGVILEQTTVEGYRLGATITRAELVKIAMVLSWNDQNDCRELSEYTYPDVDKSYGDLCGYIEWAAALSIIRSGNGVSFRPKDSITRAELSKILLSAVGIEPITSAPLYADVGDSLWDLTSYVHALASLGCVSTDTSYFRPQAPATRWEVFKIAQCVASNSNIGDGIIGGGTTTDTHTYTWVYADYGACSVTCGTGTKSRNVTCQRDDSIIVSDSYCTEVKPETATGCTLSACTLPAPGVCGSANGTTLVAAPTLNLCTTWIASTIVGAGPWTWTCSGVNGGTPANCTAQKTTTYAYAWVSAEWNACSLSCGGGTQTRSVVCQRNDQTTVADSFCTGTKPITTQSCNTQACPVLVNGVCGSAHGKPIASVPNTGLCTSWVASLVSTGLVSTWTWACDGDNGGTGMMCYANKPINAACGALSWTTVTTTVDTKKLCAPGTPGVVATSSIGRLSWVCAWLNFWNSKSCSALKKIDASCGTVAGTTVGTIPTTGLCGEWAAGTVAETASGALSWTCNGYNGGTNTNCNGLLTINATCGTAHNSNVTTAPTINLCSKWQASAVAGTGPWTWNCLGYNGWDPVSCVANKPVDGGCGTANGWSTRTIPTANLCTIGTPSSVIVNGAGWSWTCAGQFGWNAATCGSNQIVDAACGTANNTNVTQAPTANLCTAGTASAVTGNGPFNWTCTGQNGGNTATCTARLTQNATCGTANGTSPLQAPTTNLCADNSTPAVVANGTNTGWTWTCAGANGGAAAPCTANMSENATCGQANGQTFATQPANNLLCTAVRFAPQNITQTANAWTWTCAGTYNGAASNTCTATMQVTNGTCGADNGANLTATPTLLCNTWNPTTVNGTGPWTWACQWINGWTPQNCTANLSVNGVCWWANGWTTGVQPVANLCNAGTPSAVAGGAGPWTWTCAWTNGWTTANCGSS